MITSIGIKNVRVFQEWQDFEMKPISILTGANNSGKSTLQKMLKLLKHSFKKESTLGDLLDSDFKRVSVTFIDFQKLKFDDEVLNEIGGVDKNQPFGNASKNIGIRFSLEENSVTSFFTSLSIELLYEFKGNNNLLELSQIKVFDSDIHLYSFVNINLVDEIMQNIKDSTDEEELRDINPEERLWDIAINDDHTILSKWFHTNLIRVKKAFLKKSNNLYNYTDEDYSEFFTDQNSKLILPLYIYELVFNDKFDIFANVDDTNNREISNILIDNDIYTKEDFLKEAIAFEKKFIETDIIESLEKKRHEFSISSYIEGFFDFGYIFFNRYISPKYSEHFPNYFWEIHDSPISQILQSDSYNDICIKLNTKLKYSEIKSEEVKSYDLIVSKKFISSHFNNLIKPISVLSNSLFGLLDSNHCQFNDSKIKPFYIFSEASSEEDIFYIHASTKILDGTNFSNKEIDFVNKWLNELNIAEQLIIEPLIVRDIMVGVSFSLKVNDTIIPIDANSIGTNLLLQLLLKIAFTSGNLILEEPESKLHPSFQSKLAELISEAYFSLNTNFIIETHSEYLIRKFQYLVADNNSPIKPNDIHISFLYNPNYIPANKKQVETITINEDGSLEGDFGPGFFDEATNWKVELMRLKHSQKN